jgi:flagellar motor protein MotB
LAAVVGGVGMRRGALLLALTLAPALALTSCAAPALLRRPRVDRELVRQLEHEVAALKERNKQLGGAGSAAAVGPHPIYAELMQVFTDTEVRLWREGEVTVVVIPATLLFSGDDGALRQEAALPIDLLATALNAHPELRIELAAHTDDVAPTGKAARATPTNWERSFVWARAVQRALVERHGVAEARFGLVARADTDPMVSNDTPGGRAANRRVELRLRPGPGPAAPR